MQLIQGQEGSLTYQFFILFALPQKNAQQLKTIDFPRSLDPQISVWILVPTDTIHENRTENKV